MSKYLQRGAYHFVEFANSNSTYGKHVDDLLAQLEKHIGHRSSTLCFEVGCGEGLILNQIGLRFAWKCEGNDADAIAVDMARRLNPHATIHLMDDLRGYSPGLDVVLFCDSLEHIKTWREHLAWAMQRTLWIVIAVPDRHDPHGERDFAPDSFDPILSEWGECVHRATRHARHLTIWKAK